jgi:hypothetical protein
VSDNQLVSTRSPVLYTFVETAVFTGQLEELASIETLYAIQADLLADPERWPVIPGTKGARKGCVADPRSSRGKRGSFRYIYLYLKHRGRIYLLLMFGKSEQANLSPGQTRQVAELVEAIKQEVL